VAGRGGGFAGNDVMVHTDKLYLVEFKIHSVDYGCSCIFL
jgi:hypothetical protein